MLVISINLIRH